ncbi:hypothetical protein [Fictibacillus phosphorivorans]|uniref:hypothetical protein n=1 Tax=Fictibacillus phosphorivorans TaxID=1221500 RepID=UPI0020414310|nr:hypothetical protein [Fictibacillus phosphorivorans]MCM3719399.1 hypothetical protein [Fictibacillus phosphorivorans]MCM3777123.1 hypothetical protein [Fictibacillus phosphorivorans]
MDINFAKKDDLNQLLGWCKDRPELHKNLPQYLDRDDTTVLMVKKDGEIVGVALLKVKPSIKAGSIWLHLNKAGTEYHPQVMQNSLNWLRQNGARDYTII